MIGGLFGGGGGGSSSSSTSSTNVNVEVNPNIYSLNVVDLAPVEKLVGALAGATETSATIQAAGVLAQQRGADRRNAELIETVKTLAMIGAVVVAGPVLLKKGSR